MCDASDGIKKFLQKHFYPNSINFAPSHLGSFSINISFNVISWGTNVGLTLGSFFNVQWFTLSTSYHVVIITLSLQLKQQHR
jgi:hypothetical protein